MIHDVIDYKSSEMVLLSFTKIRIIGGPELTNTTSLLTNFADYHYICQLSNLV